MCTNNRLVGSEVYIVRIWLLILKFTTKKILHQFILITKYLFPYFSECSVPEQERDLGKYGSGNCFIKIIYIIYG